jgi:hypothetical protein
MAFSLGMSSVPDCLSRVWGFGEGGDVCQRKSGQSGLTRVLCSNQQSSRVRVRGASETENCE